MSELSPLEPAAPPPRRIVAVAFFRLRVEIVRAANASAQTDPLDGVPLAIVVARRGGAVVDERSLLGNTRIDEVSPEAWALGVRPGSTIAAARLRTASLRVRVVHADAVEQTLARIAEAMLTFGATVSYDVDQDAVWVDVTGCAHLHASPSDAVASGRELAGERTLRARIAERVQSLGHVARVAIASGPRVAFAFARYGGLDGNDDDTSPEAFGTLPVHSLPLSSETIDWLRKLGVYTVRDFRALPRSALGMRLSTAVEARQAIPLAWGDDGAPLVAYVPPEAPEERLELDYGVTSTEPLAFVAKALCDRLSVRLDGRSMSTSRLELVLELDRAILPKKAARGSNDDARVVLPLTLAAPIHHAVHLLAVLRAKIESFAFEAPVRAVTLRAAELVPRLGKPLDFLAPEARAEQALPELMTELAAHLGDDRVGVLELQDSWVPEKRTLLVPLSVRARARRGRGAKVAAAVDSLRTGMAIEPTRILPSPIPRPRTPLCAPRLLARTEGIEWWRQGPTVKDHVAAWIEEVEAVAWFEIDKGTGKGWIKGWLD